MLQIYITGNKESGFLDLAPDAALDMEALSDAFDEDLTFGEFSLPVDVPWTSNNRRLLGFAERLQNFRKDSFWKCTVYDDGFPEIINAKLTILEKIGKLNYITGKFSATISGTKGLFGSSISGKYLKDLFFDGDITWVGDDSRQFASNLMHGAHQEFANRIAFAPVAIENFFDTGRPDYDNEFLVKDTVNNIIITGSGLNDWVFGRPDPDDDTVAIEPGDDGYQDYRTVPFLNFKYVLRKVFEEMGYKVTGALFPSPDFDDAYVFNNYAIEQYQQGYNVDLTTKIHPGNHVPQNLLIIDFLKSVFSFFKMYPVFTGLNNVQLKFRQTLFTKRSLVKLNGRCSEFDSTLQTDVPDGYTINYNWDSNDSYYSDRVKDLTDKTLVATVIQYGDLAGITGSLNINDIAFVQAENMYYQVADATTIPVKWDCYAEALDAYVIGGGERTIDAGLSTLCTYVVFNETTGLQERRNYVGTRQPGNYINNAGIRVVNDCGLRLFYIKKQIINGNNIPVSFNFNRDAANIKIEKYSLALKGSEGIAQNFHTAWENMKQQMETVKISIDTDRKLLMQMSTADAYEINNIQFLPYKVERTIPKKVYDAYVVPL